MEVWLMDFRVTDECPGEVLLSCHNAIIITAIITIIIITIIIMSSSG